MTGLFGPGQRATVEAWTPQQRSDVREMSQDWLDHEAQDPVLVAFLAGVVVLIDEVNLDG